MPWQHQKDVDIQPSDPLERETMKVFPVQTGGTMWKWKESHNFEEGDEILYVKEIRCAIDPSSAANGDLSTSEFSKGFHYSTSLFPIALEDEADFATFLKVSLALRDACIRFHHVHRYILCYKITWFPCFSFCNWSASEIRSSSSLSRVKTLNRRLSIEIRPKATTERFFEVHELLYMAEDLLDLNSIRRQH